MEKFFSEDINIYDNNALILFNFFNDSKFIEKNFNLLKDKNNFIEFVLPNKNFLKEIFIKDKLFIYKIIDFYELNYNIYNNKKENIYEFQNQKIYNTIEYIWDSLKDLNIEITHEDLSNEIYNNPDKYFYFLVNQLWLKKNNFNSINNEDLQILGEQMLICYYFNLFYNQNKNFLINKQSNYETFFKIINVYNNYNIDYENKTINFTPIKKNENMICNNLKEKLKLFFYFALENKIVNKNILIWFYIFFKEYMTKQLQNDYMYIVLNTNSNLIGFINKIFKTLGKEFYEYTEDEIKEIFDNFKNNEYMYKIEDDNLFFLNDIDLFEITNNLFLINKLNNKNLESNYKLINIEDLNEIKLEHLYFIFLISPLKNSFKNVVKKIKDITDDNLSFFQNIKNKNPYFFYNSSILKNFNQNIFIFTETNIIYVDLLDFFKIKNYFNIEILFYKIIMYLIKYEIIPDLNLNLKNNILYYKFDLNKIKNFYLTLYPSEEKYLNGYKKS